MPLILAIEPDPRQAAQIAAIARHRVGAELMIAATTEQALDVIGDRVPDLVLVPALLSPQDDAALAAALRVIAAAAHVRTLTIPVLATGPKKRSHGEGMLAKWRRGRESSPAPDGCDPAIFAEQISEYLREAAAERAALESELPLDDAPVVAADAAVDSAFERVSEVALAFEAPSGVEVAHGVETAIEEPAPVVACEEVAYEAVAFESVAFGRAAFVEDEQPLFPVLDRQPIFDSEPMSGAEAPIVVETPAWDEFHAPAAAALNAEGQVETEEPVGVDEPVEAVVQTNEPFPPHAEPALAGGASADDDDNATIAEIFAALNALDRVVVKDERVAPAPKPRVELWTPVSLGAGFRWPRLEGIASEFVDAREHARQAAPERPVRVPQKPEPPKPEWSSLIASLRQDIERLRGENQTPKAAATAPRAPLPEPIAARPRADVAPRKTKPRERPIQDEWGFFDPEQCGFAALLAKLNEITGDETDARTR